MTLGAGQFCTNPGLVFVPEKGSDKLTKLLGEIMAGTSPFTMLTEGIASAYREGAAALQQNSRVKSLAQPEVKDGCSAGAALFLTDAESFLKDPSLSAEVLVPRRY